MKEVFTTILRNYISEAKSNFGGNKIGEFVRSFAVEEVKEKASIDSSQYCIKGSVGQGNWAEIPWILISDKGITTTATKGYYIVYLFRADMSGVYLSLNQGWTYYKEKYRTTDGRHKIELVSDKWKEILNSPLNDFSFEPIDLHCTKSLGKGYELGHICGKFYETGKIPNNTVLVNDLRNLIGVYREIKGYMGGKEFSEINDLIIANKFILSLSEFSYQANIDRSKPSVTPEKPQKRPKRKLTNGIEEWERNERISKEAIHKAGYVCEYNPEHRTFVSNVTGKNFVEAHHLIPLAKQGEFQYSLDVPGNIISLCPNCHRAIHLATPEQNQKIIKKLYHSRKDKLVSYGIDIKLRQLLKCYNDKRS
ncbi:MrcB family domain-containing protein [Hazenella coriacea]|uniref:5-methylcytosine-specific restriction protein A n=1 Tax=Hazenella coriacea TaxID=1179467 RepID=A0A4R3LBM5_9BACL|nr:DUF3578 domain-containing protein [Hazenella coriacea]TCS96630.1 5-methylcytosine-specific restriction protein A [Hazenella coriacea]